MNAYKKGQDPGENFNVRSEHGQIWREYSEPHELYLAIPWWLKHLIYAPLFIWALWYLIVYTGNFQSDEYYEGLDPINYSPVTPKDSNNPPIAAHSTGAGPNGETIYTNVCLACHQATGQGLPGTFPPLAGSDWVAGDDSILAAIVLHGLMGPVTVSGTTYNGAMPPWGATLKDAEIAAVLTYIRSTWGNTAPKVDPETVTKVRESHGDRAPWTETDLKAAFPK